MAYGFKNGKNKSAVYTKTETDAAIQAAADVINAEVANLVATKQQKQKTATVTLTSGGWSSNMQTVSCSIVGSENSTVIVSPSTQADAQRAADAGVFCYEQEENRLRFVCTNTPTSNISMNVLVLEV